MPNIGRTDVSHNPQLISNCKFMNIKTLITNSKCITAMVKKEKIKMFVKHVVSSKPKSLLMFLGKWPVIGTGED